MESNLIELVERSYLTEEGQVKLANLFKAFKEVHEMGTFLSCNCWFNFSMIYCLAWQLLHICQYGGGFRNSGGVRSILQGYF